MRRHCIAVGAVLLALCCLGFSTGASAEAMVSSGGDVSSTVARLDAAAAAWALLQGTHPAVDPTAMRQLLASGGRDNPEV
jgi:hypothetical protein